MSTIPVGDARRNDSQLPLGVCPMCTSSFPIGPRPLLHTPGAANEPTVFAIVKRTDRR